MEKVCEYILIPRDRSKEIPVILFGEDGKISQTCDYLKRAAVVRFKDEPRYYDFVTYYPNAKSGMKFRLFDPNHKSNLKNLHEEIDPEQAREEFREFQRKRQSLDLTIEALKAYCEENNYEIVEIKS